MKKGLANPALAAVLVQKVLAEKPAVRSVVLCHQPALERTRITAEEKRNMIQSPKGRAREELVQSLRLVGWCAETRVPSQRETGVAAGILYLRGGRISSGPCGWVDWAAKQASQQSSGRM